MAALTRTASGLTASGPSRRAFIRALALAATVQPLGCLTPPAVKSGAVAAGEGEATSYWASQGIEPPALEVMAELDAWTAASRMSPGINIGNTLENTTQWETGWGNPLITRGFVEGLAELGFKTVRLPVAWDTYAVDGRIRPEKMRRVGEVVDWITGAGMFCVLNIHWDGGWIDSSNQERYAETFATFSPEAARKYRAYWEQISGYFAGKGEGLLFEALNEETNFSNEGTSEEAYATLTRVNQLFVDTVRQSGGHNARRLLIVAGYSTDIAKTCSSLYRLPKDTIPDRLFLSVHYYTPWQFCGLTEDASWGKMMPTWGSPSDVAELERLFGMMGEYSRRADVPVFVGELGASHEKEPASRVRWMSAVIAAARSRRMIPVIWDTGHDVSRSAPYAPSAVLEQVLQTMR